MSVLRRFGCILKIQIYYCKSKLKKVQKLHRLKSQPILFKASQTEWLEPLDFLRFSNLGKYR